MAKHRKRKASVLVTILPSQWHRKARAVLALLSLIASVAAVLYADEPKVALAIQAFMAIGLLNRDRTPVSEDEL
ncbi:hypothetical protein AVT26_gp29 [Streptomyces phage Lannister]|uniref:Uncharacterized protein n=1 Tax=Streptomyces phage Lannister TaxID=1674927 RepID=A0A0K1Y9E2_9CAUD|nr:hypothetical protein AVT26_gp29 [Streptomyces phage Lannister]AKY03711.1 hypothetical protein SEA_LANNISTER_29 [Streptomyces phage Lannister]